MVETLSLGHEVYGKTYDFDVFLPYMMDWVLNVPHSKDEDESFAPTHDLELLYMDAAWDLVRKGLLRPGPRATNSEGVGGDYGKGYSLTQEGRAWIAEALKNAPKPEPSEVD